MYWYHPGRPAAEHSLGKEVVVIALRRLNNQAIMVNPDLIESLEATPDTVVTLTSGNKLLVRDSMEEIREKIIAYKRRIHAPDGTPPER
jgi:flagellar protein FlbD